VSSVPPPSDVVQDDVPQEILSGPPTLTRDDVAHLAHLARLDLTHQELDLYVGQLSVILDAVATVSEVAAADRDIAPTSHAVPLTNVYREDVVRPGLTHEAALAGAPAVEEGRFRVPQILGEEQ
jgi:aspartyl-tRNA(Asn)/glutamyl-tRNA(Gln) amidotransferase subunit C